MNAITTASRPVPRTEPRKAPRAKPLATQGRAQAAQAVPGSGTELQADGRRDFDFFVGQWRTHNGRLAERFKGSTQWEAFESTHRVEHVLGGLGIQEMYSTQHWPGFEGHSVKLFDPAKKLWSIYWADNRSGVMQAPVVGGFSKGVGVFEGDDVLEGRPIRVRFVWSAITPTAAHWEQAFSQDGGQTWETNWLMAMTRVA